MDLPNSKFCSFLRTISGGRSAEVAPPNLLGQRDHSLEVALGSPVDPDQHCLLGAGSVSLKIIIITITNLVVKKINAA